METPPVSLPTPVPITVGAQRLLAFPVSDRFSSLARHGALQAAPGWIVRGAQVHPWRFSGYRRHAGQLMLVGPHHAGESLADVLQRSPAEAVSALARVAAALTRLTDEAGCDQPLHLNGVYLLDDGGLLLVPPRVVKQLTEVLAPDAVLEAAGRINHPDLAGEERLTVALAILGYRAATGRAPYPGASEEQLHYQMRRLEVVPAAVRAPGLDAYLDRLIRRSLGPEGQQPRPRLGEWAAVLERVRRDGLWQPVAAAERAARQAEARALETRFDRTFRRRLFLQRNWRTIVIMAVAVAAGGGVLGSVIARQLEPRSTRGYTPRQVVETFYASLGRLDHATTDDTVIDGAGEGLVREVIGLFVIGRVQEGYEGRAGVASAAAWVAAGQPELPAGVMVYGPSDLEIVAEQGPPQPVFRASYLMWRPDPEPGDRGEDREEGAAQRGTPMSERVFLRQDRGDWVIFRFEDS